MLHISSCNQKRLQEDIIIDINVLSIGKYMYPSVRLRRKRQYSWLRDLVAETILQPENLIYPLFVVEGNGIKQEIATMPGVYRLSIDYIVAEAKTAESLGIKAIALFPVVSKDLKTELAEEAYNNDNLVCRTVRALKDSGINIGIICDVALDPYTTHGHDGIVYGSDVDNDATIEVLSKQSIALCKAGADIIAPSDMMDGRIGAIRNAIDEENYQNICILSYAAKYASSFYGPFRDAIGSAQNLAKASKSTYQMDSRNIKEALVEIELDINEGADMILVKPGMPYLDVISQASSLFSVPIFAYQVSGEYAMMKHAANVGCFDFKNVMIESLMSFRRAGATAIFTYASIEIAKEINK